MDLIKFAPTYSLPNVEDFTEDFKFNFNFNPIFKSTYRNQ